MEKNIIIFNNRTEIIKGMVPLLKGEGFKVLIADCFEQLKSFLKTAGVHLMITDIIKDRVNQLTGLEGIRKIREITNIPMMNPDIITGISLMFLFVFVGGLLKLDNNLSFATLLIAHITFNLPYVILTVLPKLRQTDKNLAEAAQDLGCKPASAFFKVVLPSIMPGIITGMIMAFTLSLDDFIISYFTGGPGFQTLPIAIFSMTKKRVKPDMYALSTLIFGAMFILLVLMNVAQSRSDKKQRAKKQKEES